MAHTKQGVSNETGADFLSHLMDGGFDMYPLHGES